MMKLKKQSSIKINVVKIVLFILLGLMTLSYKPFCVYAEDIDEIVYSNPAGSINDVGLGVSYMEYSDHVEILNEYLSYGTTKWVIPSSINGKPVTVIKKPEINACSSVIEEIIIPDSVKIIEGQAFMQFSKLSKVNIPSGITKIESGLLSECTSLKEIEIPNGVKEIGNRAFAECTALEKITIPDSCTVIGASAFYKTSSLKNINLAAGTTYIGSNAFQRSGIESVSFSGKVVNNGAGTSYDFLTNEDGNLVQNSILGKRAFQYCNNLKSVDLPGTLKHVKEEIFYECTELESIKFHNGTETIQNPYTFSMCSKLTDIYLPASLNSVECEWYSQEHLDNGTNFYIHYAKAEDDLLLIWSEYQYARNMGYIIVKTYEDDFSGEPGSGEEDPEDDEEHISIDFESSKIKIQWGDWLFWASPETTNYNLAIAGCVLSAAAENSKERAESIMAKMGMNQSSISSVGYGDVFNVTAPASTIGHKVIEMEDGSFRNLVVMTVRGTTSTSDVITDAYSLSDGFITSGDNLIKRLNSYTDYYLPDVNRDDIIYYITGHSLGGVSAVQVGKRLNAQSLSGKKYVYAFAPPKYKSILPIPESFIHQFINTRDVVPKLPPNGGLRLSNVYNFDGTNSYLKPYYAALTGGRDLPKWNDILITEAYSQHCNQIYMSYLLASLDDVYVTLPGDKGSKIQYISVLCPVDVEVFDNTGKLVARIKDNIVDETVTDSRVICDLDGDKKYVIFATDGEFRVEFIGNDTGEMTYSIGTIDTESGEITEGKRFDNVKLFKGKALESLVKITGSEGSATGAAADSCGLFVVDPTSREALMEVQTDGTEILAENAGDVSIEDIPEDYVIPEGLWMSDIRTECVYTGSAIKPSVNVYYNKCLLVKGIDYSISYKNNVNAVDVNSSKAPVIKITGKGAYSGKKITKKFSIKRADISDLTYTASVPVLSGKKASFAFYNNGAKVKGSNLIICSEGKAKWTESGKFTVNGKGNYEGQVSILANVVENVSKLQVTFDSEKLYYDGTSKTPKATVTDKVSGNKLIEGVDYIISTSNDVISTGKHKISVIGIGKYKGAYGKVYSILKPINASFTVNVDTDGGIKLNKKGTIIPSDKIRVLVKLSANADAQKLLQGRDYVLTYSKNKAVGTAKYQIKGIGNYAGITIQKGEFLVY